MSPLRAFAATTGMGAEPAPPPLEVALVVGLGASFGHKKYAPNPSRTRTARNTQRPLWEGVVAAGRPLGGGAGVTGADGVSNALGDSDRGSVGIVLSGIMSPAQSAAA